MANGGVARGGRGREILTNWKAVKPKAERCRSLQREKSFDVWRGELGEPGKRRVARHSCQDDPRPGIFRAEIKSRNVYRCIFADRVLYGS